MHPILLDDQLLFTEFETFIEAVDNIHELALDGNQQFPVLSFSVMTSSAGFCFTVIVSSISVDHSIRVFMHFSSLNEECELLLIG